MVQYNKMKVITFEAMTKIYVRHFQYCGILPFQGKNLESFKTRSLRVLLQSNLLLLCSMYCISMMIEPEKVLTNGSYWMEILTIVCVTLHYSTVVSRRNGYHKVLNLCQDIWNQLCRNERLNVTFFESKLRIVYQIYFVSCVLSMAVFAGAAIYLNSADDMGVRHMPLQIFLSVQNSPWYEIIFVTEVVVAMCGIMVYTSYPAGLPFLYILMICGLLKTVRQRLVKLEKTVRFGQISKHELKARLLGIIKFHNEVISLLKESKNVVGMLFFAQIPWAVIVISMSLFVIVTSADNRNKFMCLVPMGLLISFGFNFVPELLTEQGQKLSKAISMSYLISRDKQMNQILLIFNSRIQNLLQLQAGGLYVLSIEFFGKILFRSFSFFNFLRKSR